MDMATGWPSAPVKAYTVAFTRCFMKPSTRSALRVKAVGVLVTCDMEASLTQLPAPEARFRAGSMK
ncbi:hypothetical protein D3C86_2208970 [compost metagenome]